MKLVTFSCRGRRSIGIVSGQQVIDLPASDPAFPDEMVAFLRAGPSAMERAHALDPSRCVTFPLADVSLEAPISTPTKFLAIGMNYAKHVEEARAAGIQVPASQVWFNKQVSCINGPYGAVRSPAVSDRLDYEGELAVVIGRRCWRVSESEAAAAVAGYMICNDVSVRDWQLRSPTMTLGKSFNTHGPIGPWIVTADEITEPHALALRTFVNGALRQSANTGEMIHNVWQQIAYLSTVMTLEPGDILATGTPSGVGAAMTPPTFLTPGDVVRIEIERIGHIENLVTGEPA